MATQGLCTVHLDIQSLQFICKAPPLKKKKKCPVLMSHETRTYMNKTEFKETTSSSSKSSVNPNPQNFINNHNNCKLLM